VNLLYPKITWRQFSWLLLFGLAGALVAGLYGVLHDQWTYSIAPEYFTRLKFQQFHYLSRDQPTRLLVAEIGFLASWWVGFFSAWFMGRLTVPHAPVPTAARRCAAGVLAIVLTAMTAAFLASWLAPTTVSDPRLSNWSPILRAHRVTDAVAFVRVAYIHNASYLGGLVGLLGVLVWLRVTRRR
jgi:hypothetical protein